MDPRAIVATLLAFAVVAFMVSGAFRVVFSPEIMAHDNAQLWADLIKTICGGLLVYIARDVMK